MIALINEHFVTITIMTYFSCFMCTHLECDWFLDNVAAACLLIKKHRNYQLYTSSKWLTAYITVYITMLTILMRYRAGYHKL